MLQIASWLQAPQGSSQRFVAVLPSVCFHLGIYLLIKLLARKQIGVFFPKITPNFN